MKYQSIFFAALFLSVGFIFYANPKCSAVENSAPAKVQSPFFRVGKSPQGQWWLVDPNGTPFFSTAIIGVDSEGDINFLNKKQEYKENILKKYGSLSNWGIQTTERLGQWGFNTLGTWSSPEHLTGKLPYTPIMNCSGSFKDKYAIPDFFSQEFQNHAFLAAEAITRGRVDDPYLVGYFLDNEMHWGVDHRGFKHAFDVFFSRSETEPGKQALIGFLRQRYPDIRTLNTSWHSNYSSFDEVSRSTQLPLRSMNSKGLWSDRFDFLAVAARKYFQTCSRAIRARDPNHLLLGSRLISTLTFPEVLAAAAETQDVISVNFYEFVRGVPELLKLFARRLVSPEKTLREFHTLSNKPLLISEFGFKSWTLRTPSTSPPIFPTFPTQAWRAKKINDYLKALAATNYVVGYQFFKYMDEPFQGRFDGENSNWGLVDIKDKPYEKVVNVISNFNSKMVQKAKSSTAISIIDLQRKPAEN